MHPRERRRRYVIAGIATAVVVILALAIFFIVFYKHDSKETGVASDVTKMIPVNGAELAAEIITPRGVEHPPLIIMPGSFGGSAGSYKRVSLLLARSGYEVVAYGQRGFGGSTGQVDFGGPATQRDAREVITWALGHTPANPDKIAMFGMSYGAGISLLTAAHDPRVRVVVALSTWTDLAQTFDAIGTPHTNALRSLIGDTDRKSAYDATTRKLQTTLLDHPADLGPLLKRISAVRSPATYVKQLNANKPAIMIANAFEDSIFPPAQLIPFFERLDTAKRLELAPGDHGGPEATALSGTPNDVIDDVTAWLGHYLRGAANGIDKENPIVIKEGRAGELRTYKTWPVATKKDVAPLGQPNLSAGSDTPTADWAATIHTGKDSGANSSPIELVPSASYRPPVLGMSNINRAAAFIWNGPALPSGLVASGTPELKLGIAATAPTVTMFLYLYDVTPDGAGTLIDMQPYTATRLKAHAASKIAVPMQPVTWSVPPGDHLTLVMDTVDPRYQSLTKSRTTLTVGSTKKTPAWFSVPAGH